MQILEHLTHIWSHEIIAFGFHCLFSKGALSGSEGQLMPDSGRLEGEREELWALASA